MNTRIKELRRCSVIDVKDEHGHWVNYEFDEELFAELIIRECAAIARDFVTVENNKCVDRAHISPWQLQFSIEKHFRD
jgi:hypothetical protein